MISNKEELFIAKVLPEDYDFEANKELIKPSTSLREGLRKFAECIKNFILVRVKTILERKMDY